MKKLFLYLFFFFLIAGGTCRSKPDNDLTITYIANEGFMISSGNTKVLIDALFNAKHYTSPSDSTITKLYENTAPLNDINYIIFSHVHQDHFSEKICSEFMKRNTGAKFISVPEASEKLQNTGIENSRITSIDADYGELKEIKENNPGITAFRLMHGTNPEIQNLAYIININGFNVMHVGDGFILQNEKYLNILDWEKYNIDVLFIGYMDANNFTIELLSKSIKPKHIVLMHIHSDDIREAKDRNEKSGANAIVFEKELETKTFSK